MRLTANEGSQWVGWLVAGGVVLAMAATGGCPSDETEGLGVVPAERARTIAMEGVGPSIERLIGQLQAGSDPSATQDQADGVISAIDGLLAIGPSAVSPLAALLKDPSPYVRAEAGTALALYFSQEVVSERHMELVAVFVELLDHPDHRVRRFALARVEPLIAERYLGAQAAPLVEPLVALLDHRDSRYGAISALGQIGPPAVAAIPRIRLVMEESNSAAIASLAGKAISDISDID